MVLLILAACSPERTPSLDQSHVEKIAAHPNVVITAPTELIGAALTIDGSERRVLWPNTLVDRSRWASFWRRALRLNEPAPSAAKTYLELKPGKHIVAISRDGYRDIVRTFEVSGVRQEMHISPAEVIPVNARTD